MKKKFPTFVVGAFTLIEVMVAMALLALIVIALMAVFTTTQNAFRASITQTDVLEGGRATMDLMAGDLGKMAASDGFSNATVNFRVNYNNNYQSLNQSLIGVNNLNTQRTNILENFFILSSGNQNGVPTWYGTGYVVLTNSPNGSSLYSLYRFSTNHPMAMPNSPYNLFYNDFSNFLFSPGSYSHLIDGVVGLRLRAFDTNGTWILFNQQNVVTNFMNFSGELIPNEVGYVFYSNALPASVEIEMATVEDQTLRRAEVLGPDSLTNQSGKVHIFRQRVSIPNAYQ